MLEPSDPKDLSLAGNVKTFRQGGSQSGHHPPAGRVLAFNLL